MKPLDRLREKAQIHAAYHHVFDTLEGKRVLIDLVRRHGVLASTRLRARPFTDGMAQALEMAHADGERNVILSIIRLLNISLDDLIREVQEEEARGRSGTEFE